MSGMMFNRYCEPRQGGRSGKSRGKSKQDRFLSRRRYLESEGLITEKQNQKQPEKIQPKKTKKKPRNVRFNVGEHSKPRAFFPKFTSYLPNSTYEPSSSAQAYSRTSTYLFPSHANISQRDLTQRMAVPRPPGPIKYLALDCEMVGTGPKGAQSELARCSIVSYDGDVVYDKYVKPINPVTDYRTRWSGIRRQDLLHATPFYHAQKEIVKIITGKVVVGHAIHNDFKALKYFHPAFQTRDTSRIPLLNEKAGFPEKQCVSLKKLTQAILKRDIQTGYRGHSSVEDAKATMELYKVVERMWEQKLASLNLSAKAMDLAMKKTR
ncbi:interferon-stimulated 20 kDa exonuclease-like 2 [Danio rerio]|uniref:Interferon-stimulated 20 kDa exonuclease-like 2 n=1 Tax=Danio rerio TaxID=7955 RepID=A3KH10_DANRE|nr:interferon-stimulated 20 kDa exonuclease-like 2 [Danio rerio]AAI52519.1 Interferon stimulated exonuclease gene 20-like 2 [Danio rerio]|eukprot:NP_001096663.1 interferon-stimulated 20 kDa exonuclease-like 2 [Danio rerio]